MGTREGTEMSAQPHHNPSHLDNPDVRHETDDINVRAILWFVGVLTGITIAIQIAMWGMFQGLAWYEVKNEPYVTPLAQPAGTAVPGAAAAGNAVDRPHEVPHGTAQLPAQLRLGGREARCRAHPDREGEGTAAAARAAGASGARRRVGRHQHRLHRRLQRRTQPAGGGGRQVGAGWRRRVRRSRSSGAPRASEETWEAARD